MTATLEEIQSEWRKLVQIVQQGEDVLIMDHGQVVARLTGVPPKSDAVKANPTAWHAKLAQLREKMATGKIGPSTDEILDDLRSDRG